MASSGYSGTPLAKKLGIKEGFSIRLIDPPNDYFEFFTDFPKNIFLLSDSHSKKDFLHFFVTEKNILEKTISQLKSEIVSNGMIWVSWPKKSSGVISNIDEDSIRNTALLNGLVDIKVCAINEVWSGLKLVIPVKDR